LRYKFPYLEFVKEVFSIIHTSIPEILAMSYLAT